MAFLDNSGDIILDAVLTDTGRYRLAKGDGSFKIAKFALGDDEIDYSLYNRSHPSGSAYYDLDILQTPVLEAFTDNAGSLKSKLVSYPRTDLLYLPVLKLNENAGSTKRHSSGAFLVTVDDETEDTFINIDGILYGSGENTRTQYIRLDQGLDTIDSSIALDPSLRETEYIIEIDNRLGSISQQSSTNIATWSYLDDDNIASYILSENSNPSYVQDHTESDDSALVNTFGGARGTKLLFGIRASENLRSSDFLFEQLGNQTTVNDVDGNPQTVYKIDAIVRVMGSTTGFSIDIPVRFIKNV